MGLLAFTRDENGLKSDRQNKANFDAFRIIGLQRRARGLRRGARGLRCMLPSGIQVLKESNINSEKKSEVAEADSNKNS